MRSDVQQPAAGFKDLARDGTARYALPHEPGRRGALRRGPRDPIGREVRGAAGVPLQPPADVVVEAADQRRPAQRAGALAGAVAQPLAQLVVAGQLLERIGEPLARRPPRSGRRSPPPGRRSRRPSRPARRGRGRPPAGDGPAPRARRCRWNRAGSGTAARGGDGRARPSGCARPRPASRPTCAMPSSSASCRQACSSGPAPSIVRRASTPRREQHGERPEAEMHALPVEEAAGVEEPQRLARRALGVVGRHRRPRACRSRGARRSCRDSAPAGRGRDCSVLT